MVAGVALVAAVLFWLVSTRNPAPAEPPPPWTESLAGSRVQPSPENPVPSPARPEADRGFPGPSDSSPDGSSRRADTEGEATLPGKPPPPGTPGASPAALEPRSANGPGDSLPPETARPPTAHPADAERPASPPASLEEALIPYRWDYVTEKPSHSFSHSLFFQSDGSAYSIGRSRQWRFSWKKTGSHSLRLERDRDTLDLIFNETFTRFTGESSNAWSAEGRRSRLRSAGDLEMLEKFIRQFPVTPLPPPNGNQTPPP